MDYWQAPYVLRYKTDLLDAKLASILKSCWIARSLQIMETQMQKIIASITSGAPRRG